MARLAGRERGTCWILYKSSEIARRAAVSPAYQYLPARYENGMQSRARPGKNDRARADPVRKAQDGRKRVDSLAGNTDSGSSGRKKGRNDEPPVLAALPRTRASGGREGSQPEKPPSRAEWGVCGRDDSRADVSSLDIRPLGGERERHALLGGGGLSVVNSQYR